LLDSIRVARRIFGEGHVAQQHPDFPIVSSFPGIGKALAPCLIAALGTQRERFPDARSIQSYSGIAPVREASGRREWVHARWACPKFLKQTFQEWAQHSMRALPGRAPTMMYSERTAKVTKPADFPA
jgi:transposase